MHVEQDDRSLQELIDDRRDAIESNEGKGNRDDAQYVKVDEDQEETWEFVRDEYGLVHSPRGASLHPIDPDADAAVPLCFSSAVGDAKWIDGKYPVNWRKICPRCATILHKRGVLTEDGEVAE